MTTTVRLPPSARIAVAVVVMTALVAVATPGSRAAVAQTADSDVRLELLHQELSFAPDGTIHLEYRLSGLDGDPLELAPDPAATTDTLPIDPVDPSAPQEPAATEPAPTPVRLAVEIANYRPITTPSDAERVVGSNVDPEIFDDVSNAIDGVVVDLRPLATREDDGTVHFTLDVPTDVSTASGPDSLRFPTAGLSPLRVQVKVGDDDRTIATAGTIVQRLPAPGERTSPPIDLAVLVAAPQPGPQATPDELNEAAAELQSAVDVAATLGAPVTLEAPPSLVATAAGTPEAASALADSLSGAEVIAMPLVPLDVSSAVEAGRADAYTRLLVAGSDMLTDALPTTPIRRDAWIARGPLSAAGAQHLRELGVRYVIVPESVYRRTVDAAAPEAGLFVEAALPDGGRLPLLMVDDLSAELTPSAADNILDEATPTEWAVRSAAEMLIEQANDDAAHPGRSPAERSRVLSTSDLLTPDPRLLEGLVRLVDTTPSLRFTAASELTGVTDVQRDDDDEARLVRLPDSAGPSLNERVALIDDTALNVASAASMLPSDDPRPAAWTAELDSLISTGYTDADVDAAISGLLAEAEQLRDAIVLPTPFTFTLTGRSGTIDIRLRNTSDDTLSVVVRLESTKIGFPDGDQIVALRPNADTTVSVPVDARSNGTSSIELSVFAPSGELLHEPVTLTARVTGLTGLGQVLTGGFILVLLTWWFSHWRNRRRAASTLNGSTADDLDQDLDDDHEVGSETL